jgi:hypothetical protein
VSVSDKDIFSSANMMIDHFGNDALIEAMKRETNFCHAGDTEGAKVWKRIGDAIEWMQMPENLKGDQCH